MFFFGPISVFVNYSSREWSRKPSFHDFLQYTFEKHNGEFEWPRLSGLSSTSISSDTGPRFWGLPHRHVLLEKLKLAGNKLVCQQVVQTWLCQLASFTKASLELFTMVVWVGMREGFCLTFWMECLKRKVNCVYPLFESGINVFRK